VYADPGQSPEIPVPPCFTLVKLRLLHLSDLEILCRVCGGGPQSISTVDPRVCHQLNPVASMPDSSSDLKPDGALLSGPAPDDVFCRERRLHRGARMVNFGAPLPPTCTCIAPAHAPIRTIHAHVRMYPTCACIPVRDENSLVPCIDAKPDG
jgi:hypothetical protein